MYVYPWQAPAPLCAPLFSGMKPHDFAYSRIVIWIEAMKQARKMLGFRDIIESVRPMYTYTYIYIYIRFADIYIYIYIDIYIYIHIYIYIYMCEVPFPGPQGCTERTPAVYSRCKNVCKSSLHTIALLPSFLIAIKTVSRPHWGSVLVTICELEFW